MTSPDAWRVEERAHNVPCYFLFFSTYTATSNVLGYLPADTVRMFRPPTSFVWEAELPQRINVNVLNYLNKNETKEQGAGSSASIVFLRA
ncbi:hypothetical protein BDV25DRAFT_146998 [Aspergillus avenaceus]|uniref:Uncharacterized protein n=1 Tax=Aspergillus avenaceus TaxID=36643 RepID=A0A5N6U9H6_ASPAV|nr:hypothetical protein BDV25DRAFT_146998 [Aspergillus avenaceus]